MWAKTLPGSRRLGHVRRCTRRSCGRATWGTLLPRPAPRRPRRGWWVRPSALPWRRGPQRRQAGWVGGRGSKQRRQAQLRHTCPLQPCPCMHCASPIGWSPCPRSTRSDSSCCWQSTGHAGSPVPVSRRSPPGCPCPMMTTRGEKMTKRCVCQRPPRWPRRSACWSGAACRREWRSDRRCVRMRTIPTATRAPHGACSLPQPGALYAPPPPLR
jgi:hypothetical protein